MSLLQSTDITIKYKDRLILTDVNFAIEKGEIVTIVGPNGSGKSSFLKALVGVEPIAKGKITRAKNLTIGYVPQRLTLDKSLPLTVDGFLSLTASRASSVANHVNIDALRTLQLADLSGGELQRVLLVQALQSDPDILVLDEPTQGLDQPATADFYTLLELLQKETGCAVLMVSHELHVVMSRSDRVICLNGHICCEGTPSVVASAPEYRALFGEGTKGALALYRHQHDHDHGPNCGHDHSADKPNA
jgi:zinc transport system ATP-binding protein